MLSNLDINIKIILIDEYSEFLLVYKNIDMFYDISKFVYENT